MRKLYYLFLLALLPQFVGAYTQQRVSVHDPSIVWDNAGTYYVFGSHQAWAKSTDLMNWSTVPVKWGTASSTNAAVADAFTTNMKTTVKVGGQINRLATLTLLLGLLPLALIKESTGEHLTATFGHPMSFGTPR